MFTLKHIKTDGSEELHYGRSPTYVHPQSLEGRERGNAVVHYYDSKDEEQTIRWGKVYVMNEHGRTVASYEMGEPSIGEQTPPHGR